VNSGPSGFGQEGCTLLNFSLDGGTWASIYWFRTLDCGKKRRRGPPRQARGGTDREHLIGRPFLEGGAALRGEERGSTGNPSSTEEVESGRILGKIKKSYFTRCHLEKKKGLLGKLRGGWGGTSAEEQCVQDASLGYGGGWGE